MSSLNFTRRVVESIGSQPRLYGIVNDVYPQADKHRKVYMVSLMN